MIRRFFWGALFGGGVLLVGSALSTEARGQSLYSLRGLGEDTVPYPAKNRALGTTGAAVSTPGIFANPALLAFTDQTMFSGTFVLDWTQTKENQPGDPTRQEYGSTVTNLSLLFPLPRGLVFGTGLLFDRRIEGQIETPATIESQAYTQVFERDGSFLRFPALIGGRVAGTELGAGVDALLFTSKRRWRNEFPSGSGFASSADLDRETLWSFAPKIGARRAFGTKLALGAWGSWPRELRGSRFLESDDAQSESDDVKIHTEEDLPMSVTAGAEATPHPRMRVAFDWTYEAWEEATPLTAADEYHNVHRFAVGIERVSGEKTGLIRSLPIRAGFRTQPLHFLDGTGDEIGDGETIREMIWSVGSGFGFAGGGGQFDWVVEYGRRGNKETEFREQFVSFGVTLTGFERWARRRPPEED